MKRAPLALLIAGTIACLGGAVFAKTYEGRVETVEESPEAPAFPSEMLYPQPKPIESLPDKLTGRWYGKVTVAQLQVYRGTHQQHPYWKQFIDELEARCHVGQSGQLVLEFKKQRDGSIYMQSSNISLGRLRLRMTPQSGKALVAGGTNVQKTVANKARVVENSVEQTRLDNVSIVDASGKEIEHGYTEISAHYSLISPRRMSLKLLEIDYDDANKPLYKILLRGTATR